MNGDLEIALQEKKSYLIFEKNDVPISPALKALPFETLSQNEILTYSTIFCKELVHSVTQSTNFIPH
jgi:hypothetical protein